MNTKQRQLLALAAELNITPDQFQDLWRKRATSNWAWCSEVAGDYIKHQPTPRGVIMLSTNAVNSVMLTPSDAIEFADSLKAAALKELSK